MHWLEDGQKIPAVDLGELIRFRDTNVGMTLLPHPSLADSRLTVKTK